MPAFQSSDSPAASIIVPLHGRWDLTSKCLRSLAGQQSARHTFEVILIDDCSPDDTAEQIGRIPGVISMTTPRNLGFVGACNLAARAARGGVLVFLNNDAFVHAGWLDALLDVLDEEPTVGLVGSLLLSADGKVQESGGIIWSDGTGHNYGRGLSPGAVDIRARRDVDYCSGASIAVRRDLFDEVGGFDRRFSPAYYEDTDLCFAARSRGMRVVVEPTSVVTHLEGASHGVSGSGGLKRFQAVNRHVFARKWRTALQSHGRREDPAALWKARNRRPEGMVLIADYHVPRPDQDSGSRRLAAIIDELLDMDLSVHFAPRSCAALQPYTEDLERKGVTVLVTDNDQNRFLWEAGASLRAAMVCRPTVAWHYFERIYQYAPDSLLIYDSVDLHSVRLRREAALSDDVGLERLAEFAWTQESAAMRAADISLVVSDAEAEFVSSSIPGVDVRVLTNIHTPVVSEPRLDGRTDILFVGSFRHPPNVDAATWAATEIMPLVSNHLPEARLRIVGSGCGPEVEALSGPHVVVDGWVPDLTPVYATARVVIAPLRFGAGVKGKIGEAIEHGVPVVATSVAMEGMHLDNGVNMLIGDDAGQLASTIVRLFREDELWYSIAGRGQEVLRTRFSAAAARSVLEDLLSATPPRARADGGRAVAQGAASDHSGASSNRSPGRMTAVQRCSETP